MSKYADIIERLEKADGCDRGLDAAIAMAVDGFYEIPAKWDGGDVGYAYRDADGTHIEPGHGGLQLVPRYSHSIDAALALVKRRLPDWVVEDLSQDASQAGNPWGCELAYWNGMEPSLNRSFSTFHNYPSAALAILAALLGALRGKEFRHER